MEKDVLALESILKAIVDNPDQVEVTRSTDEMGVLLTVKIAQVDAGKVIGRQGETVNKIREVMRVIGMANESRVNVKLDVPELSRRSEDSTGIPDRAHGAPPVDDPIGFDEDSKTA